MAESQERCGFPTSEVGPAGRLTAERCPEEMSTPSSPGRRGLCFSAEPPRAGSCTFILVLPVTRGHCKEKTKAWMSALTTPIKSSAGQCNRQGKEMNSRSPEERERINDISGDHSPSPYPRGYVSKPPNICLKPQIAPSPIYKLFFSYMYIYTFSLKGSALCLLFGTSD